MRRLLLVALAACSSKTSAPPPAKGSSAQPPAPVKPALPRPTMKASQPIDLPDAGITKLRVVPIVAMDTKGSASVEKGVFDVDWTSDKHYDAGITCRLEVYNLAYFGMQDLDEDAKPNEHEALYRPDPFALDPRVCEVRFVDKGKVAARACYADGVMTPGTCPAGTFNTPLMPDKMSIDVQGASLALTNSGDLVVKAMFIAGKPLADKKTALALTCDGVASENDPGEGLVPLSRLEAGETLYTRDLAFFMKKKLTALPKQCELTITNKTKLGTFCIADGSTDDGPCPK